MGEPIIILSDEARETPPRPQAMVVGEPGLPAPDEVVFSSPGDASRKFFIPRFRIATRRDERGIQRQRITLERGADYVLSVYFEPYPAPRIAAEAANARPAGNMARDTDFDLQLICSGRARDRLLLNFTSIEDREGLVRASVRISNKDDQTLFNDLVGDSRTEATFRAMRKRGTELLKEALQEGLREELGRVNQTIGEMLFLAGGHNYYSHIAGPIRTSPVNCRDCATNQGRGPIADLYRRSTELNNHLEITERIVSQPLPPIEGSLDRADIPPAEPQWLGLMRRTVGGHHYYQDVKRPLRFYYLPDYFDLDADNGTPAFLKVRRSTTADEFQIDYHAVPRVDVAGRLRPHGRRELLDIVGDASKSVELHPLIPEGRETSVSFRARLPERNNPHHWSEQPRPGAAKTPHKRVSDSFNVTPDGLTSLFDSLFGESAVLFTGTVDVQMVEWRDQIEFTGRISGDKQAAWDRIYDDTIPAQYKRAIRVEAQPQAFSAGVASIVVRFKNGNEVTLTRDALQGSGESRMDLEDYVLRRPDERDYQYRILVRRTDRTEATGNWRTSREPVLVIEHIQ